MNQSFDFQLSAIWNTVHRDSKVVPEQFWDICRELSNNGILQFDKGAVSTIRIGPFNIATKLETPKKDIVMFFLESVFPALVAETTQLTFDEAYPLYFIPAFKVLKHVLDNTFNIKSVLQWEVLIYIKKANESSVYPTIAEVVSELIKLGDSKNIEDAVHSLLDIKNCIGTSAPIISIDQIGRIHSLV